MDKVATAIFLVCFIQCGDFGETDWFLAEQNKNGYPQDLLFETIAKYQSSDNKYSLAEMLESKDVQKELRDAAVKNSVEKLENRSKMSRKMDEPLDDPAYCEYYWLSWLPWLGCPHNNRQHVSLRFSDNVCNVR